MKYKLYRISPAEDWTPIDKDGNELHVSNLCYLDDEFYRVEVWQNERLFLYDKDFETLKEANEFIKEEL